MSITANFLRNTSTLEEIFVKEPPSDFVAPQGWELIDREVTQEEYDGYTVKVYFRLLDYCSEQIKKKPVHTINFETELDTSLYFEREYVFGRKVRMTAYSFSEGNPDYTNPILRVTWDNDINSKRMVSGGEKHLSYWKTDGSVLNQKNMPFHKNDNEQALENEDRRRRIISELKSEVQDRLVALGQDSEAAYNNGEAFMAANQTYVDSYIQRANYDLITEMQNSTASFMDITPAGYSESIRDFIVNSLDYKAAEDADAAANSGVVTIYKGSLL